MRASTGGGGPHAQGRASERSHPVGASDLEARRSKFAKLKLPSFWTSLRASSGGPPPRSRRLPRREPGRLVRYKHAPPRLGSDRRTNESSRRRSCRLSRACPGTTPRRKPQAAADTSPRGLPEPHKRKHSIPCSLLSVHRAHGARAAGARPRRSRWPPRASTACARGYRPCSTWRPHPPEPPKSQAGRT